MTDNNHPITPPPELVNQWLGGFAINKSIKDIRQIDYVATQASRWGADQELEACCEHLEQLQPQGDVLSARLRAARRPKPPSLKEQALDAWDRLLHEAWCQEIDSDLDFVRRALEALPDD